MAGSCAARGTECAKNRSEERRHITVVDGHLTVDDARRALVDAGWLDG
jgi:hypothetical protein